MKTFYISLLALALTITAQAQTVISFETQDYKKVGVYDSWEQSPFREDTVSHTSRLQGNALVTDNFLKASYDSILGRIINSSDKIVGFQRSHYGSNLYGVRIDLNTPIRITKTGKYVHVMTYMPQKPSGSKMMLIGLGKHSAAEKDWAWQKGEDEQFWSLTANEVEASDKWQDVVFSVSGWASDSTTEDSSTPGIDIYSLVIVPDVASRSNDQDFMCYFDSIVVDNSSIVRFASEYYAVNFDKNGSWTHGQRSISGAGITVNGETQSVSVSKKPFNNVTTTTVFTVKPGDVVTPKFNYSGTWMGGFVYVDWDRNGIFTCTVNSDGKPASGSDIVSYRGCEVEGVWRASDGSNVSNGNQIQNAMPAFTVPQDASGLYRMRFKVDWANLDAAGNPGDANGNNTLIKNGGAVIDVMLNVQTNETLTLTQAQLNGDIQDSLGHNLAAPYNTAPAEKAYTVLAAPAAQFHIGTLTVKYGYDVRNKDQFDKFGNPKYFTKQYTTNDFSKDNKLTIPATIMIGNSVDFTGYFVQGERVDTVTTMTALVEKAAITDLSKATVYLIVNANGGGYICYDQSVSAENLSITGITGDASATHGINSSGRTAYTAPITNNDPNVNWTLTQEDGKFYLYNVGKKGYAYRASSGSDTRTYKFTDTKTALTGVKSNNNGTFSFLSGDDSYTDGSRNFMCVSSNNYPNPVVQWTYSDAGSQFYLVENPNLNGNGDITGIDRIISELDQLSDATVYDVSGRRLPSIPSDGVYIQNRRKYKK